MITGWMIYGIGILDSLKEKLFGLSIFLVVVSFVVLIVMAIISDIYKERVNFKPVIICLALSSVPFFTSIFLPTTKLAASMVIIPAIANNESLQNISKNTLKGLEALTEDWIKELRPGDEEKEKGENL